MKRIFSLFIILVTIVLGATLQSILFRNEQQQVVFRFIEERITKIQEVLLEENFNNKDLIFFGDSVAENLVDPKSFDYQSKWTRSYNFAMPIRELDVNLSLLTWFNKALEHKADLAQLNIVFELSFLQLGSDSTHAQFVNALSAYNSHQLPVAKNFDLLTQVMPLVTSIKTPYIQTQLAVVDLLMSISNLSLFEKSDLLHFEWINFNKLVLVERWSNPKLFDPSWDSSRRGYFDFNYSKNRELLDKMNSVASSPSAQKIFYNFYKSNLCNEDSERAWDGFDSLLAQLKITKSKVHNLVVVIAPISPTLYDAKKCHTKTDVYLEKIRNLGIIVIDQSNAIQPDCFFDLVHVNELGAREWTKLLISDLNKSFAP